MAVNFTATYNSVAACLPHMLEHGEGSHIVVTSSMSGILPGANLGVYTATKIGVVGPHRGAACRARGDDRRHLRIRAGRREHGQLSRYRRRESLQEAPAGHDAERAAAPKIRRAWIRWKPGERVLNGVIHNDLFIVTHPEYMPGTKQRLDAMY